MPSWSPENIVKYEELSGAFGVDHKYFEALKNTQFFKDLIYWNLIEFQGPDLPLKLFTWTSVHCSIKNEACLKDGSNDKSTWCSCI